MPIGTGQRSIRERQEIEVLRRGGGALDQAAVTHHPDSRDPVEALGTVVAVDDRPKAIDTLADHHEIDMLRLEVVRRNRCVVTTDDGQCFGVGTCRSGA